MDLRAPARSDASRSRSSSNSRVRRTLSALAFSCAALLVLLNDDEAGRKVGDADRAIGGVDRLAARSRRCDRRRCADPCRRCGVDILRFGQHRNGRRGGVDSPAASVTGTLGPGGPALELQPRKYAVR